MLVDWQKYMDKPIDMVRENIGLSLADPYREFYMQDAPGADKLKQKS